ncbi:MAG: hypothetical protein Q9221_003658 [Calogaya cf. arnoldii]
MTSRRVIPSMLSQRRAMQPVYLGIRRIRGKVFSHRSLHERIGFINDGFADNDDQYPDVNHNYVEGVDADLTSSNLIADLFPSLLPSVPSPVDRAPDVAVSNPFQADGVLEHPRLRSEAKPVEVPVDGVINGLIKFRLHQDKEPDESVEMRRPQFLQRYMKSRKPNPTTARGVPYLPPEFGRGLKLDPMDLKLMRFYISAFCPGRTLLPMTNTWLTDVAAMAERSECVKHALLSLAASYVLDYAPADNLKARATLHHSRAVRLLDSELAKAGTYQPGVGEEAICTLAILNQEDIINWELWQPRDSNPKWFRGVRAIKYLLDKSDPGYRYKKPVNVQSTTFRRYMSNVQA